MSQLQGDARGVGNPLRSVPWPKTLLLVLAGALVLSLWTALIEFALALPEEAKLQGTSGKHALKQAAATLLPAGLLAPRKQGFSPPFSAWARGPLRETVCDVLSAERVRRAGVLDPTTAASLLEEHVGGQKDRGRTLWTLSSLKSWAENWLPRAPAPLESPA